MSSAADHDEWMERAAQTLRVLRSNPALWGELRAQVAEFFAAHPEEPDTAESRDLLTVIVFRRLTSGDSTAETPVRKTA